MVLNLKWAEFKEVKKNLEFVTYFRVVLYVYLTLSLKNKNEFLGLESKNIHLFLHDVVHKTYVSSPTEKFGPCDLDHLDWVMGKLLQVFLTDCRTWTKSDYLLFAIIAAPLSNIFLKDICMGELDVIHSINIEDYVLGLDRSTINDPEYWHTYFNDFWIAVTFKSTLSLKGLYEKITHESKLEGCLVYNLGIRFRNSIKRSDYPEYDFNDLVSLSLGIFSWNLLFEYLRVKLPYESIENEVLYCKCIQPSFKAFCVSITDGPLKFSNKFNRMVEI